MANNDKPADSSQSHGKGCKHIFGPVNSRRLGLSLGVDLLPEKICSYDCLYCEVALTNVLTCERAEYVPTVEVIEELEGFLQELSESETQKAPDVITVTGSGEPTLHTGIGAVISFIKSRCDIPVTVLTNGSMLFDSEVRKELFAADVVIPSLDSALSASFRKINRPARECCDIPEMIGGLAKFTEEFDGEVWLEILLADGINDSEEDFTALVNAIGMIQPAKVQLNTIVRPPAESWAKPVSESKLVELAGRITECPVEIIAGFKGEGSVRMESVGGPDIEKMLKRRPCTLSDIREALGLGANEARKLIDELIETGQISEKIYNERKFYQSKSDWK